VSGRHARGGTLVLGGGFAGSWLRVVTDWTVALFFRRDIAELGTLGSPRRLDAPY
jgi:hypothetical protein